MWSHPEQLCSYNSKRTPEYSPELAFRLPFKTTQNLEPEGRRSFTLLTTLVVKMKANMADAPYVFERGRATTWSFSLVYAQMSQFLPVVHQYLAASRLPVADREDALQVPLHLNPMAGERIYHMGHFANHC